MKRMVNSICLFVLVVFFVACGKDGPGSYTYRVPLQRDDGWAVASAADEGLRTDLLESMMLMIDGTRGDNIHNILIFKNGKLVLEEYFEGYLYSNNPPGSNGAYITYDYSIDHFLASVSKTVTSAIFGAAVKEGYITDLDEKIIDIFPEYSDVLIGEKANISIRHLLTMSAGLSWDESSYSYTDPRNDVAALFNTDDPLRAILDNTFLASPGTEFLYNSGATNILGAIIENKTAMSLLSFGNQYLFDPLGVQGGLWEKMGGGLYFASGGVYLRPRELARIGHVFLNKGYWGDSQLVTEDWIEQSVSRHIATGGRTISWATHYGFQWWIKDFRSGGKTFPCYFAAGWGDQYMFVFPASDMIVVFNGGNYFSYGSISHVNLLEEYILPSLK
ncbi:MAG: serine hydrolase [Marinilabiliaceae bacterium]|jgi:hypothetical protein|nr:serine hydrolase [Marinilabiliaceae bacterium]